MRRAITSCAFILILTNWRRGSRQGRRRHYLVGRYDADRNHIVRVCDHGFGRHRDDRIEIASSQRIAQVTEIIGEKCLHQRKVGAQGDLEEIALSVDLDDPLALGGKRANAGRSEDAPQTKAAGANPLDERPLRDKLHLDFAGHHLTLGFGVEANMADDRLAHQLGVDELTDAVTRPGRVVGDHGELPLLLTHELVDEALRGSYPHEPADHQAGAVGNE